LKNYNFRLPRIDGSLDRLKSRKVTLPQAHRVIQSLDVETRPIEIRPNAYDEVIRPPQRSTNNNEKNQIRKTATLPPQPKPKLKHEINTDVTSLLRTYKKVLFFSNFSTKYAP